MKNKKVVKVQNTITLFVLGIVGLTLMNILFLLLVRSEEKTISLLKKQLVQLEQDNLILASSEQITESYVEEIALLTKVFPNEETILPFLQALEALTKESSDEYSVKFTSLTPLLEQDKLYLVLSVNMKTDKTRLHNFLNRLERLPYMTHITSTVFRMPDGFDGKIDVSQTMKVYVQNPFDAK